MKLQNNSQVTNLSQFNTLSWSVGWLTPDTPKQTARTADRLAPALTRVSAITCSNVSLAAASVSLKQKEGGSWHVTSKHNILFLCWYLKVKLKEKSVLHGQDHCDLWALKAKNFQAMALEHDWLLPPQYTFSESSTPKPYISNFWSKTSFLLQTRILHH